MSSHHQSFYENESNSENQFTFFHQLKIQSRRPKRKLSFASDNFDENISCFERELRVITPQPTMSINFDNYSMNCEDPQSQNFNLNSITHNSLIVSDSVSQILKVPAKKKIQKISGETKNIPRHYGSYLRKFIINYYSNELKINSVLQKFVNSKAKNNNYRRCDFQELFRDELGSLISRDYFNGIHFIQDVTESKRLTHINSIMKYVKIFYKATFQPEILNNLKKD